MAFSWQYIVNQQSVCLVIGEEKRKESESSFVTENDSNLKICGIKYDSEYARKMADLMKLVRCRKSNILAMRPNESTKNIQLFGILFGIFFYD